MALSLGSALATKVYLGATEVSLAYLGATQVYTSSAFSAEAQDYFDRLDTAGDTTYVDYKQPLANYIDSLVTLGGAYWDDLESAASFVGVGIQGVTVPLKSTMTALTNNNFVAGDLDTLTGLKGDASTKYLDTGSKFNDFPQNDFSMSANITEFIQETTTGNYLVYNSFGNGVSQIATQNDAGANPNDLIIRCQERTGAFLTDVGNLEDFYGINRTVSTGYSVQYGASSTTVTATSQAPANQIISILGASTQLKSNARMATYHIGPALNLATLRGLQATLLSEIAAAKGAAAAENYFARLDTAGDTTYIPYKQPLTNYISSLVALGGAYWDTMLSATSFVGVGIQGITVPLRDGMTVPTQNNFVAADLNQLTGLKGNLSSKWIDTNIGGQTPDQDDNSISTYATEVNTYNNHYLSTGGALGATHIYPISSTSLICRISGAGAGVNATPLHFAGATRSAASVMNIRANGTDFSNTNTSVQQLTDNFNVFGRPNANRTDARLATYHIGPALDLATLEGLQDTLLSEIAAVEAAAAAENYFARLVTAGDTTHTAYKTPITNYFTGLFQNNLWDKLESSALFVGVGIQGVTVPLRDGMTVPTQNNFVAGDLNTLTGLLCNGSTKRISTNTDQSNYAQNDTSVSTYRTETVSGTNPFYFGTNLANGFGARGSFITACYGAQAVTGSASTTVGLLGLSRSASTGYDYRSNGTTGTRTTASVTPASGNLDIFAINGTTSGSFRLATYHAGSALDLATLEGLQDTLISEIAAI